MSGDRTARAWALITERADGQPLSVAHVCAAAIDGIGVDGAGVSVMAGMFAREIVHGTDQVASTLEELQLTFGQGPCVDAFEGGPVLASDLRSAHYLARWPAFTPAAVDAGAGAVFALPLQIGAIRLGVVDFYRRQHGELTGTELIDALIFADAAIVVMLDARARAEAGEGSDITSDWRDSPLIGDQATVHQAAGMVSVQLGVRVDVALVRIRAHAFATGRRLGEVAHDVVARRLRFHPDPTNEDTS